MVMEPISRYKRNDLRNWASLEESVQDFVEDFKYLEGCHIKGLHTSQESLRDITSNMDKKSNSE